ncbi:MAG: hypothetical protein ILP19_05150 [Oscillospiraceae bacterium]|nr:hypothetical protein [Oscillospiraceae bacterium]
MDFKFKKTAAFHLSLLLIVPMGASVYSEENPSEEQTEQTEQTEDEQEQEEEKEEKSTKKKKKKKSEEKPRTEAEAFALMTKVAGNDKLELYKNEKEYTLCLKDLRTGKMWWSNPVDLEQSNAKKGQKNELASGIQLIYAKPYDRSTTIQNNKGKGKTKMTDIPNGVKYEYKFSDPGITVPVEVTLEDDHLKVYVDKQTIKEAYSSPIDGQLITNLAFFTTFGAAGLDEKGYFVIPDGCGAVVEFNNGKTDLRTYSGKVYGRDITVVKQQKTAVTRNVSLPMYGIVKGDSALMVVASKGDACASINTYVSNQNKTDYNSTYFDFELRTSDEYMMGGDSNPLKVFEKRGILVPEIEVRYYPVVNENGGDIDYTDIANEYRDYLIREKGVADQQIPETSPLYVDIYGGTLEKKSVLGIPVTVKQPVTKFDTAKTMLETLKGRSVDNMVVTYSKFSGEDLGEKITDSWNPASNLGGSGGWKKLKGYADSNNITLYPSVDNTLYKTGNGYWSMTNTSIRVSNAYSRIPVYDLAHGVENKYYTPLSLFSPASYNKAYSRLIKSYNKKGVTNFAFGSLSNTIYGDYGKAATSREMAKGIVSDIYANAKQNGSVLADNASAYVIPYADHITNVPIDSSKFDLFDYDVPFYQMVLHGVTPYSAIAVNSEADAQRAVLDCISSGSNISFDFIGEEASELKDTKLDSYYYAYYPNWMDEAAGSYQLANEILAPVADKYIIDYNIYDDGNRIETIYEGGYTTEVNYEDGTVTANGKVYKVADYLGQGAAE